MRVEGSGREEEREEEGVEMGCSEVMLRRVSAATMPPIEWPIRITRTEGSMVGEGVWAATSRSITLFWSLGGGGMLVGELDIGIVGWECS